MSARLTVGALFVAGVSLIAAAAWMLHPALALLFLGVVLTAASILGGAYIERQRIERK